MVDGELRVASSVMELKLLSGTRLDTKGLPAESIHPIGKYPIVDLGRRGWLITSQIPTFDTDIPTSFVRKGQSPFRNPYAMPFRDLHAKLPRIELPDKFIPRFIWVPPDTNLVDAKRIHGREIAEQIEKVAGVRLERVTVEPTTDPLGWPPEFVEPEWVKPVLARKTTPRPQLPRPREGDWALQHYDIERE